MTDQELHATPCEVCGKTFGQALADGTSGDWGFHWGSPTSTTIEGETCGSDCADIYEERMGR